MHLPACAKYGHGEVQFERVGAEHEPGYVVFVQRGVEIVGQHDFVGEYERVPGYGQVGKVQVFENVRLVVHQFCPFVSFYGIIVQYSQKKLAFATLFHGLIHPLGHFAARTGHVSVAKKGELCLRET